MQPYKYHKIDPSASAPATSSVCTAADALAHYKSMYSIRRFEQASAKMYQEKTIRGFLHLYVGQEAVCVGMNASLLPEDSVITAYRDHGWAFMRGIPIRSILAELTGTLQCYSSLSVVD